MCRFIRLALIGLAITSTSVLVGAAQGGLLYSASLRNGDYGGGHKVGSYLPSSPYNASGSTGGDLSTLGIVDSADGVGFTTNHDVINFSLGADGKGGSKQSVFRATGTVSVKFRADGNHFVGGQPFVDNYGFNQFATGQATFGTGLSRNVGKDGVANTLDDQVEFSWSTWHSNVWYSHVDTGNDEVLTSFDRWHHLGLTWGGTTNKFEVWLDGVMVASDNSGSGAWGSSGFTLGSAYNFALGEIHQRSSGDSSAHGILYADLNIWDEVRAMGDTQLTNSPVPEPSSICIFAGCLFLGVGRRRSRRIV